MGHVSDLNEPLKGKGYRDENHRSGDYCFTAPAFAQVGGGKRNRGGIDNKKSKAASRRLMRRLNKAAVQSIPEPKEKCDPLGIARSTEAAKDFEIVPSSLE